MGLTPSTVGHGPVPMACAEAVECRAVLLPTLQALSAAKSKNNAPFCPAASAAKFHAFEWRACSHSRAQQAQQTKSMLQHVSQKMTVQTAKTASCSMQHAVAPMTVRKGMQASA